MRIGLWAPFVSRAAAAAALAMLGACAVVPPEAPTHRLSAAAVAAVRLDPAAAVAALNAYRKGKGLEPVRLDPALSGMAERQAKAMAGGETFCRTTSPAQFPARLAASGIDDVEGRREPRRRLHEPCRSDDRLAQILRP